MRFSEDMRVSEHATGRKKIYVVNDDQVIARTRCLILERAGYETSAFFSAESALEAIQQAAPDLVLSDVMMTTGAMSGMDFAEILARAYPLVKVMLFSGPGYSPDKLQSAPDRGLSAEIRMRPIAPMLLLAAIGNLFGTQEHKLVRPSSLLAFQGSTAANSGGQALPL